MVAGGAALAAGIPILVIGARKVPADPARTPPEASLAPEIRIAPTRTSVAWRF
jgi:hypothetical protein